MSVKAGQAHRLAIDLAIGERVEASIARMQPLAEAAR
jgi:hypothetical protein